MNKKQSQTVWKYKPDELKFTKNEKETMINKIKETICKMSKLSQKVSKLHIRTNYIYMYEMVEQFVPEGVVLIKPLIDGKYLEYPYARITLNDKRGDNCTADCQRHTGQWMTLYTGTLDECINSIEEDDAWF